MKNKNNQNGFTLLELLLVIAMIGILATIGVARYQSHIVESNRRAAQTMLLFAQQQMERKFLRSSSYENITVADLAMPAQAAPNYALTISDQTATTYTLNATPNAADALCGVLSINQTGSRTAAVAANSSQCWQ